MWVDTVCRFFKPPFFTEHGSNECSEKTLTNLFTSYVIADWSRNVNFYRASNCTLNPILLTVGMRESSQWLGKIIV